MGAQRAAPLHAKRAAPLHAQRAAPLHATACALSPGDVAQVDVLGYSTIPSIRRARTRLPLTKPAFSLPSTLSAIARSTAT